MTLNGILKNAGIEIELPPSSEDAFGLYAEFLAQENRKYNLTAISDAEAVYVKHFADSLTGAEFLPRGARVADVGAGAGFPSIPLLIARPDLRFTLIDSVGKKTAFLSALLDKLGLTAEVVHARVEDLARPNGQYRECFDSVVARAVAPLPVLLEYCMPFVRVGGALLAFKTSAAELDGAANALSVLNCAAPKIHDRSFLGLSRIIIEVSKHSPTPALYPRPNNKPRQKPL